MKNIITLFLVMKLNYYICYYILPISVLIYEFEHLKVILFGQFKDQEKRLVGHI